MTYSHRNIAEEQIEASQKAKQITAICEQLHIKLDPIDWQNSLDQFIKVTISLVIRSPLKSVSVNAPERSSTFFHQARQSLTVNIHQGAAIPFWGKHT